MVLTLGTGAGTSLFGDGGILPHLELAHHPIHGNKTYDEYVGNAALAEKAKRNGTSGSRGSSRSCAASSISIISISAAAMPSTSHFRCRPM